MTKYQTEYVELCRKLKQLDGQLDRPALEELKAAKAGLTSRWRDSCPNQKAWKAQLSEAQLELLPPEQRAAVEPAARKQIALLRGEK